MALMKGFNLRLIYNYWTTTRARENNSELRFLSEINF